jgi:hypothetical protein
VCQSSSEILARIEADGGLSKIPYVIQELHQTYFMQAQLLLHCTAFLVMLQFSNGLEDAWVPLHRRHRSLRNSAS